MDPKYVSILQTYVSDVDGHVLTGTPTQDVELELNWTQQTWEDGRPVNKCFGRCQQQLKVTLKAGVEVAGAWYRGLATGCHMLTFCINDIWYEAKSYEAEEIIQALGFIPEEI